MADIHIGFTGTANGMTRAQRRTVEVVLGKYDGFFHHGDCVGADEEAHNIAKDLNYKIIIHPPTDEKLRAFCKTSPGYIFISHPYLVRNKLIVGNSGRMIAAPKGPEELRSSTWSTVRYARSLKKPIKIVWPNGKVTNEGW